MQLNRRKRSKQVQIVWKCSMVEEEFFAAQDCPIDILEDGSAVFFAGIRERLNHLFLFGSGGWPTKGIEIKIIDDLQIGNFAFHQFGNATISCGELLVDRITVGKMKNLRDAGFKRAFTFARLLAIRASKSTQKIGIRLGIGQLNRAQAQRILVTDGIWNVAAIDGELAGNVGNLR